MHEYLLLFRSCAQYHVFLEENGAQLLRIACHFAATLLGSSSAAELGQMLGDGRTICRDSTDLPGERACSLMTPSCMELVCCWGGMGWVGNRRDKQMRVGSSLKNPHHRNLWQNLFAHILPSAALLLSG